MCLPCLIPNSPSPPTYFCSAATSPLAGYATGFTILYFHSLQTHLWWGQHVPGPVQGVGNEPRDEQAHPPSSWHPGPLHLLLFVPGMASLLFCPEIAQPSTSSSNVTLSISLCQLSWAEPSCPTLALIISACNYLLSKSVSPRAVSTCRARKHHCVPICSFRRST